MIRNLARDVDAFTSNVFLVSGERPTLVDAGSNFDVVAAVRDADGDGRRTPESDAPGDAVDDSDRDQIDAVDRVVLTHTHYDHVDNLGAVRDAFDVDVFAFDGSVDGVDRAIGDEETLRIGDHEYRALHTPGHKDDHLCFYADGPGVLFAGDLVFANGGFGRTDLDEGDRPTLIDSVRRVLDVVDEDLAEIHTGHGPSITRDPYRDVELALQAARA